jgi:hypothetical protein
LPPSLWTVRCIIATAIAAVIVVINIAIRVATGLRLVISTAMLIVLLVLWAGDGIALSSLTNARLSMAGTYLLLRSAMIVTDLASIFGDFSLLLFCTLSLLRFSEYFFSCICIPNELTCS